MRVTPDDSCNYGTVENKELPSVRSALGLVHRL